MTPLSLTLSTPIAPTPTVARIIAQRFGITWPELLEPGRDRQRLVLARHTAAWLLRSTGLSYPEVGKLMQRHHTTAMESCRAVERMRADKATRALTDAMRADMVKPHEVSE